MYIIHISTSDFFLLAVQILHIKKPHFKQDAFRLFSLKTFSTVHIFVFLFIYLFIYLFILYLLKSYISVFLYTFKKSTTGNFLSRSFFMDTGDSQENKGKEYTIFVSFYHINRSKIFIQRFISNFACEMITSLF